MGAFLYCESCGAEIEDEIEAFVGCSNCGSHQHQFGVEQAIILLLEERKERLDKE